MSDLGLKPISGYEALLQIHTELYMALNNGALVVGQKVDPIDREHVEKAAVLVKLLMEGNRK
jgi:hypothetical protein